MGACATCPAGARLNGAEVPGLPVAREQPRAVVVAAARERRRGVVLSAVRRRGRARLRDVVADVLAAGVGGARGARVLERTVRADLAVLASEGALHRLCLGWYGRLREVRGRADDAAALAWADGQAGPWRPADLQRALAAAGVTMGARARSTAHRAAQRLVERGAAVQLPGGFYLAAGALSGDAVCLADTHGGGGMPAAPALGRHPGRVQGVGHPPPRRPLAAQLEQTGKGGGFGGRLDDGKAAGGIAGAAAG